jgi:hypothetical protein
MAISFQSDEEVLRKLRDRFAGLRRIRFSGSWKKLGGSGSLVETLGNTGRCFRSAWFKNVRSPMAPQAAVWHPEVFSEGVFSFLPKGDKSLWLVLLAF